MVCVLFCIHVTYFIKKNKALKKLKTNLGQVGNKKGSKERKRKENKAKLLNRKNLQRPNDLGKEQRGHSSCMSCDRPEGSRGQSHITAASTGVKRRSFQQDAAEGLRQCYK